MSLSRKHQISRLDARIRDGVYRRFIPEFDLRKMIVRRLSRSDLFDYALMARIAWDHFHSDPTNDNPEQC